MPALYLRNRIREGKKTQQEEIFSEPVREEDPKKTPVSHRRFYATFRSPATSE
jgi:hypothetical protein